MMRVLPVLLLLLIASCAQRGGQAGTTVRSNNGQVYGYRDVSGTYEFSREVKMQNNKLATRVQLLSGAGSSDRLLEKTFAIAAVGSVKLGKGRVKAVRPELSQHTVWLEGKKYFSQMKLNTKRKVLEVILDSPDSKWQGKREIKVPRGSIFCFYSQLPECLVASGMLASADGRGRRVSFVLVWDSWPYHQEQFTGLGASPFAPATVSLEKHDKSLSRYNVEVNGQALSLHFSKETTFVRMFWMTQGISITPPSELQDNQEM